MRATTAASSAAGLPRKSWTRSVSSSTRSSSIASRSAGATGTTKGSSPASSASSRSSRAPKPWTVWTQSSSNAALELVLDAGAQRVGGRLGRGQREDLLGRQAARGGEPRVAGQERAGLAGPGGADDDERTAAMCGHLALRGGEAVERIGHAPRI